MLVLSRLVNQSVDLFDKNGNHIARVMIVDNFQGKVKLGFMAADDVEILRSELSADSGNAIIHRSQMG